MIALPSVAQIFKTAVLSLPQWGAVALISLVPFVVVEAEKTLFGSTYGKNNKNKPKMLSKNKKLNMRVYHIKNVPEIPYHELKRCEFNSQKVEGGCSRLRT